MSNCHDGPAMVLTWRVLFAHCFPSPRCRRRTNTQMRPSAWRVRLAVRSSASQSRGRAHPASASQRPQTRTEMSNCHDGPCDGLDLDECCSAACHCFPSPRCRSLALAPQFVFAVFEKSQIQALQRAQPILTGEGGDSRRARRRDNSTPPPDTRQLASCSWTCSAAGPTRASRSCGTRSSPTSRRTTNAASPSMGQDRRRDPRQDAAVRTPRATGAERILGLLWFWLQIEIDRIASAAQ